jgi:hypothetical protein
MSRARVRVLVSQHFDNVGQYSRALQLIADAVAHTPTLVELHMFKARVEKHMGRIAAAADTLDFARQMDLGDRYVNACVSMLFWCLFQCRHCYRCSVSMLLCCCVVFMPFLCRRVSIVSVLSMASKPSIPPCSIVPMSIWILLACPGGSA